MWLSLQALALFARRRYRLIFVATTLAIGGALALAHRLNFDTDILALLPRDEPKVEEFRRALDDFGTVDYLLIAVRVPADVVLDPYLEFVDLLGRRLEGSPLLSEVEYRLGDPQELVATYLPTSFVFLPPEALEKIAQRVSDASLQQRARELHRLIATPQWLLLKDLVLVDPLGVGEVFLQHIDTSRAGLSVNWASGYFLSRDQRMLLLLARPTGPPQDVDFSRTLAAEVRSEIAAVSEGWPALVGVTAGGEASPPPEVVLGGRHVIGLGDEAIIKRDVLANILTSALGVLTLFLLAFRRLGPLLYAVVPLACGLIFTFGFASLSYGVLSSATSGVAALLIGLGIDFVIVSYGRYVEERKRGKELAEALAVMSGSSGRAVVIGGVTSAATFYAFGTTGFTGLKQMGLLTGTGILFCMAAVLVLLPALLSWTEDHYERRRQFPRHFLHGFGSARLIRFSLTRPRLVLGLGALATAAGAFWATGLEFVDSISAMRPKGNPGVEVRDEVAERYGVGFDQMMLVLAGDSAQAVLELSDRAMLEAARLVSEEVLIDVDGVSTVLPPLGKQRRALAWLEEARRDRLDPQRIRATFAAALRAEGLRDEPFAAGLDLFAQAAGRTEPVSIDELRATVHGQRLVDRYLHHDEEGWKSVVYLYPPPKEWRREPPPAAVSLADGLGDSASLTGANVISSLLRQRVLRDSLSAAVLGFVAVAILLWIDFRRLGPTALSLAPLTMGLIWMLGAMAALGLPMNFMNIFVSTMIIGIGVDYGVHMIHRHREFADRPRPELHRGLTETGRAIVIAALSTLVGFGSLARSSYPGLASMGLVAILGAVSTCLAAITVLPAYLAWSGESGAPERENPTTGQGGRHDRD